MYLKLSSTNNQKLFICANIIPAKCSPSQVFRLNQQYSFMTIYQVEGHVSSRLMNRSTFSKQNSIKILRPFFFPTYSEYHKGINNQFVSPFNLSTCSSIIGRYLNSFDSILTKNLDYLLLEFSTTINSYSSEKSISTYNILPDKISNCFCSHSIERSSFRPSGKLVSTNNQSSIPFSIQWIYNINNQVCKQLACLYRIQGFLQIGL